MPVKAVEKLVANSPIFHTETTISTGSAASEGDSDSERTEPPLRVEPVEDLVKESAAVLDTSSKKRGRVPDPTSKESSSSEETDSDSEEEEDECEACKSGMASYPLKKLAIAALTDEAGKRNLKTVISNAITMGCAHHIDGDPTDQTVIQAIEAAKIKRSAFRKFLENYQDRDNEKAANLREDAKKLMKWASQLEKRADRIKEMLTNPTANKRKRIEDAAKHPMLPSQAMPEGLPRLEDRFPVTKGHDLSE